MIKNIIVVLLLTVLPEIVHAQARTDVLSSYWDLTDSVLRLTFTKPNKINIVFAYPKSGLRQLGVIENTPFFTGEQLGASNQIAGTATMYSRYCPPAVYTLRGHISV